MLLSKYEEIATDLFTQVKTFFVVNKEMGVLVDLLHTASDLSCFFKLLPLTLSHC